MQWNCLLPYPLKKATNDLKYILYLKNLPSSMQALFYSLTLILWLFKDTLHYNELLRCLFRKIVCILVTPCEGGRDFLHLLETGLDCLHCLEGPVHCFCPGTSPTGNENADRWTNLPLVSCPSQVPEEMSRCRNSYTEQELKPLTLEALGHLCNDESADYQHFLQDCVDNLFKEVKEKFKGWVSCSTSEQAELSYKKVSYLSVISQLSSRGQDLGSSEMRPCYQNSSPQGSGTHSCSCRAGQPGIQIPR